MHDLKNIEPLLDELLKDQGTSITRHQAVEYLMILSGLNPPRLSPLPDGATPESIEVYESITFFDLLLDCREAAEEGYSNARAEKLPKEFIAEKQEILQRCDLLLQRARELDRIVVDELAKRTLRVDPLATKNPDFPWITIKSFTSWVESLQTTSPSISSPPRKKSRTKQLDQEDAIKAELRRQGYTDIMNLQRSPRGIAGPLASIRFYMLLKTELFCSEKTLELAWGRLLKERKEIAYEK
jgi:hypothetical protein